MTGTHFRPIMLYKIVTLELKYPVLSLCPLEKLMSCNTQRFLCVTVKLIKNAVHQFGSQMKHTCRRDGNVLKDSSLPGQS